MSETLKNELNPANASDWSWTLIIIPLVARLADSQQRNLMLLFIAIAKYISNYIKLD